MGFRKLSRPAQAIAGGFKSEVQRVRAKKILLCLIHTWLQPGDTAASLTVNRLNGVLFPAHPQHLAEARCEREGGKGNAPFSFTMLHFKLNSPLHN